MTLPNCKPAALYYRYLAVKDSKHALFRDENLKT